MTLIKSISGIRGTIGGSTTSNLTPVDIVGFAAAYGHLLKAKYDRPKVVIGRDGRISGPNVHALVIQSLIMMGIDVIDLELSTTPTVEMAVINHEAQGGMIITASHNPKNWNALKFLNERGEVFSREDGLMVLTLAKSQPFEFSSVDALGRHIRSTDDIDQHIRSIIDLDLVMTDLIRARKFHIVVDCINSTGAISIPPLLEALHCTYTLINDDITGDFAHDPEPLAKNLTSLQEAIKVHNTDLGIAIDPDVDRLAFMDEQGGYCGEEYTLVMVAQWVLEHNPGATVSNLSSSFALRAITESINQSYHAAPVGELNVVNMMKSKQAVIGGEGNGGIIYPELHYGRDALVGIALLLSALASKDITLSQYRSMMPEYHMTKGKINLTPAIDIEQLLSKVSQEYAHQEIDTQDGVKIYFDRGWVHLRKSNTEPIIRLYSEGSTLARAHELAKNVQDFVLKSF